MVREASALQLSKVTSIYQGIPFDEEQLASYQLTQDLKCHLKSKHLGCWEHYEIDIARRAIKTHGDGFKNLTKL